MSTSHIGLHFSDSNITSNSFPCNIKGKVILSGESAKQKQNDLLHLLQSYKNLSLNLKYPQPALPVDTQEFLSYLNSSIIIQFSIRKANIQQFCSCLDRVFYESGGKESPNSQICQEMSQFIIEETLKVHYLFNTDPSSSDDNFFVIIKSGIFEQQILDAYFDQFSPLAAENQQNEFEINICSKLTFHNILDIIRTNKVQEQTQKKDIIEEQKIGIPVITQVTSQNTESLFTAFSRSFSVDANFLSTSLQFFQICFDLLSKLQILPISNIGLLNKLEKLDLDFSFHSAELLPKELKGQIVALCSQIESKIIAQKGEEKLYLEIMELVENPWKVVFTHQLLGTIDLQVNMPDFLLFFKYFAFKH